MRNYLWTQEQSSPDGISDIPGKVLSSPLSLLLLLGSGVDSNKGRRRHSHPTQQRWRDAFVYRGFLSFLMGRRRVPGEARLALV